MRILLLNPNTSLAFTERIGEIARQYAAPTTTVRACNPARGPRSIESVYDELLSAAPVLEVALAEQANYDALVVACYSDHPTVYALRELTHKPTLGIAEASMLMACTLGYQFSVVTTNAAWRPLLWEAVRRYGLRERCASVRTTDMAVLALEEDSEDAYQRIAQSARLARDEDGAEVICLGCAGMAGLDKRLEAELGLPVLDGVVCALKLLEGLLGYGLRTSKQRAYSQPGAKELVGLAPIFSQPYQPG